MPACRRGCGRIDLLQRNSRRLLKLVNSLLEFSRIEAGRVQASYVPTDLAGIESAGAVGKRASAAGADRLRTFSAGARSHCAVVCRGGLTMAA